MDIAADIKTFLNTQPYTETVPIASLTQQYLFHMEHIRERSIETVKSRRCYLKEFAQYFSKMDVTEITNHDLDAYFIFLKNRVSRLTGRTLSPGSIGNRKRAVRVFLKWCIDSRSITLKANLTEIYIKRLKDQHTQLLAYEDIEYVIKGTQHRQDRLMIQLMYEAGLRISELAKVKIEHLTKGREGSWKLEVVGKGDKRRTTFISASLSSELHAWMRDKNWYSGYIFRPIRHGNPGEGYSNVDPMRQRIKKRFKDSLEIQMVPHQLRHAFARNLLDGGCSLRAIQKLLGHSNIETTMTYLGVDDHWLEIEYTNVHHNNLHP